MLLANRIAVGRCFVMVALNMAGIAAAAAGPLLALVLPASAQSGSCSTDADCNGHGKCVAAGQCACDAGFLDNASCSACERSSDTYPDCASSEESGSRMGLLAALLAGVILLVVGLALYRYFYVKYRVSSKTSPSYIDEVSESDETPLIDPSALPSSPPSPLPAISPPVLVVPRSFSPPLRASPAELEGTCLDLTESAIRSRADLMSRLSANPDLLVSRVCRRVAVAIMSGHVDEILSPDASESSSGIVDVTLLRNLIGSLLVTHVDAVLSEAGAIASHVRPLSAYVAEDQGPRPTMEDRACVHLYARELIEDTHVDNSLIGDVDGLMDNGLTGDTGANHTHVDNEHVSIFGVFDGHGGSSVAHYAGTHTHVALLRHPQRTTDISVALRAAFLDTNRRLFEGAQLRPRGQSPSTAGCTALLVCVTPREVATAWAGDSEAAMFYRSGHVVPLCRPLHKPWDPKERAMIERRGGTVFERGGAARVCGVLAVSRAFGNARFKDYITAEPDVHVMPVTGDEAFMVIACDGLWDVLTPEGVAAFLKSANTILREEVAEALVMYARSLGSTDNITVVVVFFNQNGVW